MKHMLLGPNPRVSYWIVLEISSKFSISNKFQDDTNATGPETTLWEALSNGEDDI